MNKTTGNVESRWPLRIGCLLVCIVFPLIWVGNLVTTTDAGMAVPDWPNTYGYNLFAYPYREWFFGPWDLFVEHGHRLLASLAGLVSMALVFVTFRCEPRRWVQFYGVLILGLVVFQGILGGVRVLLDERVVAKIHGCLGPFFFAAVVGFCVVTSRRWRGSEHLVPVQLRNFYIRLVPRFAILMLIVSFVQLALGAFIRHIDDSAAPKQFALLLVCHILTAVMIVVGTLVQRLLIWRSGLGVKGLKTLINLLVLLVLIQFTLGAGTWVVKFGWPNWFENYDWAASFVVLEKSFFQVNLVTAHAAVGSLILAFWTSHALRTNRALNGQSIGTEE